MRYTGYLIVAFISIIALTGCTCYSTTLVNAQGRTITCEAKGKDCSITGQRNYDECVAAAKEKGFRETTYHQYQEYPR